MLALKVSAGLFPFGKGIGGSAVAVTMNHQTNSSDGTYEQDVIRFWVQSTARLERDTRRALPMTCTGQFSGIIGC